MITAFLEKNQQKSCEPDPEQQQQRIWHDLHHRAHGPLQQREDRLTATCHVVVLLCHWGNRGGFKGSISRSGSGVDSSRWGVRDPDRSHNQSPSPRSPSPSSYLPLPTPGPKPPPRPQTRGVQTQTPPSPAPRQLQNFLSRHRSLWSKAKPHLCHLLPTSFQTNLSVSRLAVGSKPKPHLN